MGDEITITDRIDNELWTSVAGMIVEAVPNTIIAKLGRTFAAAFYKNISIQGFSCAYIGIDNSGKIASVIIGSLDHSRAYSVAMKTQRLKLAFYANFRLLRWAVISWVVKGIIAKIKSEAQPVKSRPKARLILIVVRPDLRGGGLAAALVEKMEEFMLEGNITGPYFILTEKENKRANRFYEKIGANFIGTNLYRGREINEWRKLIKQDM
jgi:GNAT superfamily N-acetyltransferase